MKKTIAVLLIAALALSLCGCACRHEWQDATCTQPRTCAKCGETEGEALGHQFSDATCTQPRTCAKCGETEGEALGHQFSDATYWHAAECTVCGEMEGEPLVPEFEKLGYEVISIHDFPEAKVVENGNYSISGYPYITCCYDNRDMTTKGILGVKDYRVIYEDEDHPGKEGYEWQLANLEAIFFDSNYYNEGISSSYYFVALYDWHDRKYDPSAKAEPKYEEVFSLSWQDEIVPDCSYRYSAEWHHEQVPLTNINIETFKITYTFEMHVPEGYDGFILAFYNVANRDDAEMISDWWDENTVFVRLD